MTEMTFREYHERQQLLMESDWTAQNIINALQSKYANNKVKAITSLADRSDKFSKEDSDKILDLLKKINTTKNTKINEDNLKKAISRLSNNELTAEEKTDKSKTQKENAEDENEDEEKQWKSVYDFYTNCISKVFKSKQYLNISLGDNELSSEENRKELFNTTASGLISRAFKTPLTKTENIENKQKNYLLLFFMFLVKVASAKGVEGTKKFEIGGKTFTIEKGKITESSDVPFLKRTNYILENKVKIGSRQIIFNPSAVSKFGDSDFSTMSIKKMQDFFNKCVEDNESLRLLLRNAPDLGNTEEAKEVKEIGNNKYTKNRNGTWSTEGDKNKYTNEELEKLQNQLGSGDGDEDKNKLNTDDSSKPVVNRERESEENINGSGSANDDTSKGYKFAYLNTSSSDKDIISAFEEVFGNDGMTLGDTRPFKEAIEELGKRREDIVKNGKFAEKPKSLKKSLKESYSPIFKELISNPLLEETRNDLFTLNEARITSVDDAKADLRWKRAMSESGQLGKLYNKYKEKASELRDKITTSGLVNKYKIPKLIVDFRNTCRKYLWAVSDFINNTAKKNDLGFWGLARQESAQKKADRQAVKNTDYLMSKRGAIDLANDKKIRETINSLSEEDVKRLSDYEKKVLFTALKEEKALIGDSGDKSSGNKGALASFSIIKDGKAYSFLSECYNALNILFTNNKVDKSMVIHILRIIKGIPEKVSLFGNNTLNIIGNNELSKLENIKKIPSESLVSNKDLSSAKAQKNMNKVKNFGKAAGGIASDIGKAVGGAVSTAQGKVDDVLNKANANMTAKVMPKVEQKVSSAWSASKKFLKNIANNAINGIKGLTGGNQLNGSVVTESFEYCIVPILLEGEEEIQVRTADAEKAVLMALSSDQGTAAQGKKWIVDNMYKGNPEAEKLVDEFVKENLSKRENADNTLRNKVKVAPGPGGNPVQGNQQTPTQNNQQTPAVNPAAPALPQQAMANQQTQTPAAPAQNNQQTQTPAAPAQATVTTGAADGFPNRLYKKLIRRKIGM